MEKTSEKQTHNGHSHDPSLAQSRDLNTMTAAHRTKSNNCNEANPATVDAESRRPDLKAISQIEPSSARYKHLLLDRQNLTQKIADVGLHPPLLLQRALLYEALGYADLAAADAFVAYTLCETVRSEEWVSDLVPVEVSGEPWPTGKGNGESGDRKNLRTLCDALTVLYRSLIDLRATEDAGGKFDELVERYGELLDWTHNKESLVRKIEEKVSDRIVLFGSREPMAKLSNLETHRFGWARREIYPWNRYEPDRNSTESLSEINRSVAQMAPDLVARVAALTALNEDGTPSEGTWHQLGLFAARDLAPGTEILREKSLLTAIRPLDDALCDACGADLESVARESTRQCPGEDCDTTFCSEDCATRAANEYHRPNLPPDIDIEIDIDSDEADEADTDADYPPLHAPFCANSALHEIGRTVSTTTAEWDLYFLLLTRTIQMSTTQQTHPLSLPSTKHLWGDFNTTPNPTDPTDPTPTIQPPQKKTLPWSLHHSLTLPLQYFEYLSQSRPDLRPYSARWLADFDWWIQTTLTAKFRGVANAQQSTFDGRPEIAAVHPVWCLANHDCAPNVAWTPTGDRVLVVRRQNELADSAGGGGGGGEKRAGGKEWEGIREGEQIWSHYTDIRLSVQDRRERLMEVLGGVCRCERCRREAGEETM